MRLVTVYFAWVIFCFFFGVVDKKGEGRRSIPFVVELELVSLEAVDVSFCF